MNMTVSRNKININMSMSMSIGMNKNMNMNMNIYICVYSKYIYCIHMVHVQVHLHVVQEHVNEHLHKHVNGHVQRHIFKYLYIDTDMGGYRIYNFYGTSSEVFEQSLESATKALALFQLKTKALKRY
jgi:hypothetical protein